MVIELKTGHWTQNWSLNSKLVVGLKMVTRLKRSLDAKMVIGHQTLGMKMVTVRLKIGHWTQSWPLDSKWSPYSKGHYMQKWSLDARRWAWKWSLDETFTFVISVELSLMASKSSQNKPKLFHINYKYINNIKTLHKRNFWSIFIK